MGFFWFRSCQRSFQKTLSVALQGPKSLLQESCVNQSGETSLCLVASQTTLWTPYCQNPFKVHFHANDVFTVTCIVQTDCGVQ